jgi:hypothetical protein
MEMLSYIIPLLITVGGVLIPINALNSKNNLGRTFFTDEQRLKLRYFNNVSFSLIMSFAIAYYSLVLKVHTEGNFQIETQELTSALVLGITSFIILLMLIPTLIRRIENFFFKNHIKYKVVLTEEDGPVYILRMHDQDTCICSKNPNADFSEPGEYILISKQDLMGKILTEEKIPKPPRSAWSKLIDF